MSYLPCELHCHTVHSDGGFLPRELQGAAAADGLSLIALTDHNTISGCDEMDAGIIPFIRGIEWTTYFGHMLVLGAETFVDWRDAVPDNIDEKIAAVKAAGGTVGIAHPFQLGSPMCTGGRWEFNVQNWEQVDYIEVWHDRFFPGSDENTRSLAMWTDLLDKGFRPAAVYGRDWHRPADGAFCCTYLFFDGKPSAQAALCAIQHGRTVVSAGARFFFTAAQNGTVYQIGDTLPAGETQLCFYTDEYARRTQNQGADILYQKIKLVTNGGKCVLESTLTERSVTARLKANHWYRAELWGTFNGEEACLAVTSPIDCLPYGEENA